MKNSSSSDDSFDSSSNFDDSFDDDYGSFETSSSIPSSSSKIEVAPLTLKVIDDSVNLYFEFSLRRFRHVKELNLFAASSTSADSSSASTYHWDTLSEAMAKIFVVVSENLKSLVRNDKILDRDAATIVRELTPRLINLIKQGTTKVVESIHELETSVKKRPEPPKTPVTTSIKRLEDSFAHSITRTPRSAANPSEPTRLAARTLNFQDALVIAPASEQGLENSGPDLLQTDITTQPSSPSILDYTQALSDDLLADGVDIFAKTYANTVDQDLSSETKNTDELSDFEIIVEDYPREPKDVGLSVRSQYEAISASSLSISLESEMISASDDNLPSTSTSSERTHSRSPSPTQVGLFSAPTTSSTASHTSSDHKKEAFKSTLQLWREREQQGFDYSARPHPSSRSTSSLTPDSTPTPASTPTRRLS